MRINESRGGPTALGILALQHGRFSRKFALDMRASCWAARVTGRQDRGGEYGHWIYDGKTVGDIIGAAYWPSVTRMTGASGRPTGAWSWAFPAVNGEFDGGGGSGSYTPPVDETGPRQAPEVTQSPPSGGGSSYTPSWSYSYHGRLIPTNWTVPINQFAGGPVGGIGNIVGIGVGAGGGGGAIGGGAPIWAGAGPGGGVPDNPQGNIQLWNPSWPNWVGAQADVGLPGNVPLFGFGGAPIGIQTQGFWGGGTWEQDASGNWIKTGWGAIPQAPGGLFGIGLPPAYPVFLPGFMPRPPKPKPKAPTDTAAWLSNKGDIDELPDGERSETGPVFPIRNEAYASDYRFQGQTMARPKAWPTFSRGHVGIVIPATEEGRQVLQFHPTDPRLVAPRYYGDPRSGTIVAAPNKENVLDGTHQAHLQSFFQVVPEPTSGGKLKGETTLAWLVGDSPRGDVSGGLITDQAGHAHVARTGGGPFDTGGPKCKHFIGRDADGFPVRSAHLTTSSLFRTPDGKKDASLQFSREPYPEPCGRSDWPVQVHLSLDSESFHAWLGGQLPTLWRFWTEQTMVPQTVDKRPVTPPEDEPPPPPDEGDDDPPGSFSSVLRAPDLIGLRNPDALRPHAFGSRAHALPSILAKPQAITFGVQDVRYADTLTRKGAHYFKTSSPITGRLEAFGAQGGTPGGPHLADPASRIPWSYTQRPRMGRALEGTAPGGWVLLPPEICLDDIDDDFTPAGIETISPTTLIAGPGASLGCGTPELAGGGIRDGATIEASNDDLLIRRYNSDGDETSESAKQLLDMAEVLTLGSDFAAVDLNDVTDTTKQKQVGIRTDAGNEEIQINIGGTVFGVALTAV